MASLEKLASVLNSINPGKRYYTGNDTEFRGTFVSHSCVFGLPVEHKFRVINEIPTTTKALYFYFGSRVTDLLEAVLDTGIAGQIEHLTVGYASVNSLDINNYDYSNALKILEKHSFPKLKSFELGNDFLLANSHCFYGKLGDITRILHNMPLLETLELYGNFKLGEPLSFKCLQHLEVLMDDWATRVNGGKISEMTISNLLSSKFDTLKFLYLDLDFNDNEFTYTIPNSFLHASGDIKLEHLEIAGKFIKGTRNTIISSKFRNIEKLLINEIEEPEAL